MTVSSYRPYEANDGAKPMTTEQNKSPPDTAAIGACHHSDCIIWKSTITVCDCGGIVAKARGQQ